MAYLHKTKRIRINQYPIENQGNHKTNIASLRNKQQFGAYLKMFKTRKNSNGTKTLIEVNLSTLEEKEWNTYKD